MKQEYLLKDDRHDQIHAITIPFFTDNSALKKAKLFILMILVLLIIGLNANAEDLKKIVSLSGYWKFSIGDDIAWSKEQFNDSDWDKIFVPSDWEDQGYDEYNGFAWYRKNFTVSEIPANNLIYLLLGRIDDVDEVYFNGKLIGKSGSFPPDYNSAYDVSRKYIIPADYINVGTENTIAVRVYDSYREGGLIDGNTGLYIDSDNELLNLNLTGRWKFHTGDNKDWKLPDYNDENWKRLNVPLYWDSQGYSDYDGYAWYRVNFRVPKNFMTGDMYLCLGKIDDNDDVYLNGKYIGSVEDLKRDGEYRGRGWEYNARRVYKIEGSLLKYGEINNLAIRVYDSHEFGGIYEGPIGIMSPQNYRRYKNKHFVSRGFWDYIFYEYIYDEDENY